MTNFGALVRLCGLSPSEAAAFLNVRKDTIDHWLANRRRVPDGILQQLKDLYQKIEKAATNAALLADETSFDHPDFILEIGCPTDDEEAQSIGWPCRNVWLVMAGLLMMKSSANVHIVPRGSTPMTAKAADEHDEYLKNKNND